MNGQLEPAFFEGRLGLMLADLERLVAAESPSADRDAVARSARVVAELGAERIGQRPEVIVLDGRTHLCWRFGGGEAGRLLILGHHDTVFPVGTLRVRPFRATDGVVTGPGCLDMKAGLVVALHVLATMPDRSGVTLLVTGDEEIGSPTSRDLIEQEARASAACLVLEAAADSGALKLERKGVSNYQLRVTGKAAHAGLNPLSGVNATVELAHQITAVAALADDAQGTTVTPTMVSAGTSANTVPDEATLWVDVRCRSREEQDRVDTGIRGLTVRTPGAGLLVAGGPNRPPLTADASAALFALAKSEAAELGLSITGTAVGGGSDGNLAAGVGTPTLDGLGAVGGGPHTAEEYVRIDELAPRAALLARLVGKLAGPAATWAPEDRGAAG